MRHSSNENNFLRITFRMMSFDRFLAHHRVLLNLDLDILHLFKLTSQIRHMHVIALSSRKGILLHLRVLLL